MPSDPNHYVASMMFKCLVQRCFGILASGCNSWDVTPALLLSRNKFQKRDTNTEAEWINW